MRREVGISARLSPSGFPPPFQCSSRLAIPCAVRSASHSALAMAAPRSPLIFRRLPLRVLHVAFRFDVIRSKRVKQRGGIAAEAGIFKEQRVVKIIPDIGGEMNFRGNPHSDYAGPHRMSHWLSGDQVERERERRNDLRHPKRRTRAGTSARRGSRGQGGRRSLEGSRSTYRKPSRIFITGLRGSYPDSYLPWMRHHTVFYGNALNSTELGAAAEW